jgi:hypothetical protein
VTASEAAGNERTDSRTTTTRDLDAVESPGVFESSVDQGQLAEIQFAHRALMSEYLEVRYQASKHAGPVGSVDAHLRSKLKELRVGYTHLLQLECQETETRAWLLRTIDSVDRFAETLPSGLGWRHVQSGVKTAWVVLFGLASLVLTVAVTDDFRKEVFTDAKYRSVEHAFSGGAVARGIAGLILGSSLLIVFWLVALINNFDKKRRLFLGDQISDAYSLFSGKVERHGKNIYELEDILFQRIGAQRAKESTYEAGVFWFGVAICIALVLLYYQARLYAYAGILFAVAIGLGYAAYRVHNRTSKRRWQ